MEIEESLEIVAASALHLLSVYNYLGIVRKKIEKRKPRSRRWWMLDCHRNRTVQTMESVCQEMLCEDSGGFSYICRMSPSDFNYLLSKIEPIIKKEETNWRKPIPAKVRLAVALRFLATGDTYKSLHLLFKISGSIISKIVTEVCQAINIVLKEEIKMPQTPEEWKAIEEGFRGSFPHCVGAIDGKYIMFENKICNISNGSQHYNSKNTSSIVLLALVDSNYNFIFADISAKEPISDGEFFKNSQLWRKIIAEDINLPLDCPLPGKQKNVPYVFIGDGAFALSTHVMKPYPGNSDRGTLQRTFNNRLSSSRVIVENVFGVLSSVFGIFKKPMILSPEQATRVTLSCILLHNFLRRRETSRNIYTPPGMFDTVVDGVVVQEGSWRQNVSESPALKSLPNIDGQEELSTLEIREEFAEYFYNRS